MGGARSGVSSGKRLKQRRKMTQLVEFRVAMMCTYTHKGHYSTTRPRQTYTDSQSQIRSPQPNWSPLWCNFTNVTGPAKIGHICTHNLASFLNFNLQYFLKYTCYDNEIFIPYSQINKKVNKSYRT